MKKYFKILVLLLICIITVGCELPSRPTDGVSVTLPNLEGLSRKEISKKIWSKSICYR